MGDREGSRRERKKECVCEREREREREIKREGKLVRRFLPVGCNFTFKFEP